jgi:hypothetical protein
VTNAELAAQLVRQADDAMRDRKALLCAAVALADTKTTSAARRVLAEWNGPAEVVSRAVELLDQLEGR